MKKIWSILVVFLYIPSAYGQGNWENIYKQVQEAYVYQVTVEDLAVSVLKALNKVDRNIVVGNDNRRMTLYCKGRVVKVLNKPEDKNNVDIWGKITEDFIVTAIEKSPEAERRDFELNDIVAKEMVKSLDKDSKFYGNIDEANGVTRRHKRQFVARLEDKVLYIKIATINKQTCNEVEKALDEYSTAKELIIDLQGCPGGMVGEAIKIADLFLDGGIIASSKGKNIGEEIFYTADEKVMWQGKAIKILVDEETASAAEILTAALAEQGRADVEGAVTKGKGTMQKLIVLPSGSVLAITNGFFMTPSGHEINGKGVNLKYKIPE